MLFVIRWGKNSLSYITIFLNTADDFCHVFPKMPNYSFNLKPYRKRRGHKLAGHDTTVLILYEREHFNQISSQYDCADGDC